MTLVFVHGYTLNLDCWHFQRAAFRGLVRSVYYDQRSHGRSGRSPHENATIDQLGHDLLAVLDAFVPDGPVVPFGTGNRCIMLREGYIELIAIVDPAAFSNTLDRFLARYAGIHIIALGIEDETANLDRLRRSGIDIPGVAYLERPVDDADPSGPRARFARLPLPDAPEGRLQLIRHLTPEAIWQERFLTHPNHAVGLAEVVVVPR